MMLRSSTGTSSLSDSEGQETPDNSTYFEEQEESERVRSQDSLLLSWANRGSIFNSEGGLTQHPSSSGFAEISSQRQHPCREPHQLS